MEGEGEKMEISSEEIDKMLNVTDIPRTKEMSLENSDIEMSENNEHELTINVDQCEKFCVESEPISNELNDDIDLETSVVTEINLDQVVDKQEQISEEIQRRERFDENSQEVEISNECHKIEDPATFSTDNLEKLNSVLELPTQITYNEILEESHISDENSKDEEISNECHKIEDPATLSTENFEESILELTEKLDDPVVILANKSDTETPSEPLDLKEAEVKFGDEPSDIISKNIEEETPMVIDENLKVKTAETLNNTEVPDEIKDQEETPMVVDENLKDKIAETSNKTEDNKTPSKITDNPDDIINLLKSLSPEKLLQIKSKVLEIAVEVNEDIKESTMETQKETQKNEDVICLDSDDEQSATTAAPKQDKSLKEEIKEQVTKKRKQSVEIKKLKECVNPNCPRNIDDEYSECPVFIMTFYYITRKPNKVQWICSTCYEKAIEKYEDLASNINSNLPWTTIKIPKKLDVLEIEDSDEEEEELSVKKREVPESEMFEFTSETETMCEEILKDIANRVDIKMQLDNEFKIIEEKAEKNNQALIEMDKELRKVEKKSQVMYDELYAINRPKFDRRPSLHIDQKTLISASESSVRNLIQNKQHNQSIIRHIPQQRTSVLSSILETNAFAIRMRVDTGGGVPHWTPCKILDEINTAEGKKFKVQFNDHLPNQIVLVSGKELAKDKVTENLEIGTRVIARFPRSNIKGKQLVVGAQMRFLPGVVGEKLTNYNQRRFLIFCDYGQVKYCPPSDVREVFETSENVWEDVHKNLSQFIRDYLISRREVNKSRAMLNLQVGSKILVEQASDWRQAIVQDVDCSLAKIFFPHNRSSEWLYRGSKRLHPIYMQAAKSQNTTQRSAFRRDPGISYIAIDDDDSNSSESVKKNIAKKSTSRGQENQQVAPVAAPAAQQDKITILNDDHIYLEDPANVGRVRHFTPKQSIKPNDYVKHECSEACLPPQQNNLSAFSPLAKPLLACWERQIVRQKNQRFVVYKAPCGRRLRNMHEIFNYLRITKSFLNVDNFDLDHTTQVLATYTVQPDLCGYYNDDCTEKKEAMKIPVINAFDNAQPPPLEYSNKRIPMPGVNINTDPEFMSCCDCTDDCVDKSKCACFQLTIQGVKFQNPKSDADDDDISYIWKRLSNAVQTGIYECNSRCKCSDRCLNKVVQKPIAVKMMLFRTKKRGWGLKTVHDIPKGTFICIYAGNLYVEKDANALCYGQEHGDEYFAELDLIEVAEAVKEGYEPGVVYPDSDDEKLESDSDYDEKKDNNDDDDGDFVSRSKATGGREILTRSSKTNIHSGKNSRKNSSDVRQNSSDSSDNEIPTVNMIPAANTRIPLRKLFGLKERPYVMDAKTRGNIGRYFNHSCEPNLFVQNVFVDTHDLRFPWIAFFTSRQVKAAEELTWNYQYEIGSVPSKVLYCHCGSKNCQGRIL